jgi:hypothetical protein
MAYSDAQVHTYTPDTPLGFINDDLAQLYGELTTPTHTHAAADITSGTFADARIAQSNVTQHQAALSITESQVSDLGSYVEVGGDTMTGKLFVSRESATDQLRIGRSGTSTLEHQDESRTAGSDMYRWLYQGGNLSLEEYEGSSWGKVIKIQSSLRGLALPLPSSGDHMSTASQFDGSIHFSVDETNHEVDISVKYSDGTLKTATIALS